MSHWNRYVLLLLGGAISAAASPARAGDLAQAVAYAEGSMGSQTIRGWEDRAEPDHEGALGFLISRDTSRGAPVESYDCDNSLIDGDAVMRTSGEERWAHRRCVEMRWQRNSLPGYRTLGQVRLTESEVDDLVRIAEAETDVPAALLHAIIKYESGYRPHVISDDDHIGLMQLRGDLLRAQGVEPNNLLDPRQNVLAGARYLRSLIFELKDMKLALAAYFHSPAVVRATPGGVPGDPRTIWFVREMIGLYYASIREFPKQIGAESIAFVWNWLE